jgi:tetratricopeptide (TPR) repeat protein
MEDRQIRVSLQIYLSLVVLVIFLFVRVWEVFIIGLVIANGLAFAFVPVSNYLSSVISSLIYGTTGSDDSYENRSYRTDMDQARKMVREERWNEAISFYRKILEKAPEKIEVRFELAKIYQIAGYTGLALLEYQKIRESVSELGEHHPYVLESAKLSEELRETISGENKPS